MGKKKKRQNQTPELLDVPVPPMQAARDVLLPPKSGDGRPVSLEDTIIFDGRL